MGSKSIIPYIAKQKNLLRPVNYSNNFQEMGLVLLSIKMEIELL